MVANSAKTLRSGELARLSVPTATRTPDVVERLEGRSPGPGVAVAARTCDERDAARDQPREIAGRHLHAVHRQHAANRESRSRRDIAPADRPERTHDGSHTPRSSRRTRHGPLPVCDELDLLDGFGQVDAAAARTGRDPTRAESPAGPAARPE